MLSKHLPPRTNRQLQCLRNATLRNTNASRPAAFGLGTLQPCPALSCSRNGGPTRTSKGD